MAQKVPARLRKFRLFVRFLGNKLYAYMTEQQCKAFLKEKGYTYADYNKVVKSKTPVKDLNDRLKLRPDLIVSVVSEKPKVESKSDALQNKINEFYKSWEWKRLSYDTRKKYGQICMCCGATPTSGERIICDHIKPVRKYWSLRLDPDNLQILCDSCNMGKGSRDETDWRKK